MRKKTFSLTQLYGDIVYNKQTLLKVTVRDLPWKTALYFNFNFNLSACTAGAALGNLLVKLLLLAIATFYFGVR